MAAAITPQLTLPLLEVLAAADQPDVYILQIARALDYSAGTVHPIVVRCEQAGWLTTTARTQGHHGGVARRHVALTPAGRDVLTRVRPRLAALATACGEQLPATAPPAPLWAGGLAILPLPEVHP